MWISLLLGLFNLALSWAGTYVIRLPGFDITPIGVIIAARAGESPLLAALLLTAGYVAPRPSRLSWIWLQLPTAVAIGYLCLIIPNPYVHIILYHIISIAAGIFLAMFDGRYGIYTFVHFGVNVAVARVYTLFT